MTSRTLPSVKEVETATDPSSLLITIFTYGTDYEIWPKAEETLEARSKAAAAVLLQCWKSKPELQHFLVDATWVIASVATGASLSALQSILMTLIAVPGRPGFLTDLQATLDPTLLEQIKLLADKNNMLSKIRKLNTEIHFRQQKFNLFQEESEGYAKLLTLLWCKDNATDINKQILIRFIGKFNLDPNRVLDLLLDCLEQAILGSDRQQQLLSLLKNVFPVNKLPPLLVFKISNYERRKESLPSTFYIMICLLAQEQLLDLKVLLPTALQQIHAAHHTFTQIQKKQLNKLASISLGSSRQPDAKMMELSKQLDIGIATLESSNVIIGLLRVSLQAGNWNLCTSLITEQEDWTKLCTLMPATMGSMLSHVVRNLFHAMYDHHVKTPILNNTLPTTSAPYTLSATATLDEFIIACFPLLQALSESYCLQPALYAQVCRLTKVLMLKEKKSTTIILSPTSYDFLKSFLVPSISILPPNPALSVDLWFVLDLLPFSVRYKLYGDWRGPGLERSGMDLKPMARVQAEMMAGKEARHCLKRISRENVRDMGRQVSKVTHSNPIVVFMTILNQIESYDNLIQMMVEIVRFVTPLSMDIMGYCILTRLSGTVDGANRNKLKDDGVNVSQWLSSLESFTGAFYKKCPDVEFRGILLYLIHQLKTGHVLELGVLRTLIKDAGGYSFADYSPASSLSATQLAGMAGSQLLKRETYAFGIVEHMNVRASNRIRSVLQSDDIGIKILILLAQIRNKLVFERGVTGKTQHVKLIGNLYDSCQVVTSVLLEFLTSDDRVSDEDKGVSALSKYASALPSLKSLLQDHAMDGASAWMLYRPKIRLDYQYKETSIGDNTMKIKEDYNARAEVITSFLPVSVHKDITPSLVDFFFSHSLSDVFFPEDSYNLSLSRLTKVEESLVQKQRQANSELDKNYTRDDEMDLGRVRHVASRLPEDMTAQAIRTKLCQSKLHKQGFGFFQSQTVSIASVQAFFTYCTFPRCTLGPEDAMYCAHFANLLHANKTPGFSFMHYVDELIDVVECSLYSCTEGEAASIAILLLETWKVISRWRYNDEDFAAEVTGKPGSFMVHDGNKTSPVSFPKYKILYNRWHTALGKAFLGCLQSSEYIHLRCCFLVLNRIVEEFPTRPVLGQKLLDAMGPLQDDTYPLQDISAAAQSYNSLLTQARSSGVWKEEDASAAMAREKEEKATQLQRKKKAEEQLAEMELENLVIDKENGDDSRSRRDGRRDTRVHPRDDRRSNSTVPSSEPRPRDDQKDKLARGISPVPPTFEPRPRDDQKDRVVRGREGDQGDRRGADFSRNITKDQGNDKPSRGRDDRVQVSSFTRSTEIATLNANRVDGQQRGSGSRHGNSDEVSGGLEGRWERGGTKTKGSGSQQSKRDHSPATEEPSKRRRTEVRDEQQQSQQGQTMSQFNMGRNDAPVHVRDSGTRSNEQGAPGGHRRGQGRRV